MSNTNALRDAINADLERFNREFHRLDAVITHDDGTANVDPRRVPDDMVRAYRLLLQFSYANGLIDEGSV